MFWIIPFGVLAGLAVFGAWNWFLQVERKEYDRLAAIDKIEENRRLIDIRAFGSLVSRLFPGRLTKAELANLLALVPVRARAYALCDHLLDRYQAALPDGILIGSASPPVGYVGEQAWPYVAARHQTRGHADKKTITANTLPLILPEQLRSRHVYAIGKSGYGKTTLLRNLILQDAARGTGLGVLAPEAELFFEELLPHLPEHRLDDIVFVNPADTTRPVPLNPLAVDPGEDIDLKLNETLSILQLLINEDGTNAPRLETILRYGLAALMRIPGSTLLDFPRLLDRTDDTFRAWVVGQIDDDDVRHFWRNTYPAFPKDAHLSLLNRLGRFLQPKVVRAVLCQPGSINVRGLMDAGKILLFNLSDGLLGEQNAQILGQLVVAKIQTAAMSRADIPKDARRPFHLYIDEFQSFVGVAGTSYERILSRARKYHLALTLANQQCGQVPESTLREILGNVSTLIAFRLGASDARRIGHEFQGVAPGFDHRWLTAQGTGDAYCMLNHTLFPARLSPPPKGGSAAIRDEAIRRSRERYGVVPGAVSPRRVPSSVDSLAAGDVFPQ